MLENIKNLWKIFLDNHNKVHPIDFAQLNSPATESDFLKFYKQTGLNFPLILKSLYEVNNGQKDGTGIFFGLEFLSIDKILQNWQIDYDIYIQQKQESNTEEISEFCTSFPVNTIKLSYFNPKWIPFCYDYGGNYLGLDLDPEVSGTVGQIINFGRDEADKILIAKDFQTFLEYCQNIYQTKNLYQEIEDSHFIDYLVDKLGPQH